MARSNPWTSLCRFCKECQGGALLQVCACVDTACIFWQWRMGEKARMLSDVPVDVLQKKTQEVVSVVMAEVNEECTESEQERIKWQRRALRTIRQYCLVCAGNRQEVRRCGGKDVCPLWSWRFGVYTTTYKAVRQRFWGQKQLSLF